MEQEDQEAQQPLLATAAGRSGDGRQGAAAAPASSSSSIAVVVASTAVAVAGSFEFGISVGYSSPSQPGIMRDLDLSLSEYSVFGSILTIGAMLGAIASGSVADHVGRRFAMAISDLLCILGYLLITFSLNVWWLDIGRFLTGCGIGLLSYVVPVYISEITPKNLRGGFATVNQFMICCGASLAYVLGTFITWRTLAIIGVAPCLMQLVGLLVTPESPRWLARFGYPGAFEAALQKLRGKGTDISGEAAEIKDFTEKLQHLPKSKMLDLFQKDYIHAVTVGVGLMVLQQFGGVNAICFYASEIFVSAGFSSGNTGMLAMVAVQIPMTGLGVLLMDKAGRRPLLMVSAAGTCLGCLLVGLSFLAKEHHWGKDLNLMLALAGILVGYSSPCQQGIMRDLDLSLAEYSVFGSILAIGAMMGAIGSGTVADRVGRRCAMAISDLLCILGYLLIAFSQNFWWLEVGRLSIGCGIGLLSYVVPVYIAEISPKNHRGGFSTVNTFMVCCGLSLAYVLGTFITWRTLAIIGVAPCLLQLVGLLVIPESPRWLERIGQPGEFEASLQKLRGKGTDISEEAAEIKDFTEKIQYLPKSKILDLFHKEYICPVRVGVGLMVLQQFGGMNAIYFYASDIFVSAGFSSGNMGMLAMVAVQAPVTGLGILLMDKAGRKPLLMVSAAGTCLGCILVGFSFLAKEHHWGKDLNIVLALAGILIFTGSFSLGMGGIPWVIMSEIFPINMKGTAGSLVTLVNWLGSWIVSYAFNFLLVWNPYGTFFFFASICGLTVVFVERLVPETKGRTLEEIQASFHK